MGFLSKKNKLSLTRYLTTYFDERRLWKELEDEVDALIGLVQLIRPSNPKKTETVDISELLFVLENHSVVRENLVAYFKEVFHRKRFVQTLTDAGILHDVNFFTEIKKRLFAKVLPLQLSKERMAYVLNQVFYKKNDAIWIEKVPREQLNALYDLFKPGLIKPGVKQNHISEQLIIAMTILIQRSNGRAMDTEVMKMVPEFDNLESPFSGFERELLEIDDELKKNPNFYVDPDDLAFKQLNVLHQQCVAFVEKAFRNSKKYGISLRVNQNLLRIRQQLERLKILIPLLAAETQEDVRQNEIDLSIKLIQYNCYQNNLQNLVSDSTQLLSYEITQHTAKTGEHYITHSRDEYWRMFMTALGGGLIVGFLVINKLLLSMVEASDFGYAFLYSMNYSLGFIAIYLFGFTLATKQPAMTASTIITALKKGMESKGNSRGKHHEFASLFSRLFRSQFIAFVGNVIMAFPVALLGVWLIDLIFDYNIAAAKSEKLLTEISPVHSLALFHAAIAGLYLFLSGIISGSTANKDKHNHIYYRIQEHPVLKMTFGRELAKRLSAWYEKKWAGIVSNFWFGIFMGSTASIGIFLGLNIDIRHITFASGNMALGLYGMEFSAPFLVIFWAIIGVGLIGLINFLVSFGLSLGLAFRSRRIPASELKPIIVSIYRMAVSSPALFFYPPDEEKTESSAESAPQEKVETQPSNVNQPNVEPKPLDAEQEPEDKP